MYAMHLLVYVRRSLFCVVLQAVEEKEKGNAAYKKRDFSTALVHYDKAIELDPTNVTFLTNKAGKLDKCLVVSCLNLKVI